MPCSPQPAHPVSKIFPSFQSSAKGEPPLKCKPTRTSSEKLHVVDQNLAMPIFQDDYLFLQAPGAELALHRLVLGIFLEDHESTSASFTTLEYAHTPQPGYTGFFGTFSPSENPQYDASNAKSGMKLVRRQGVTRGDVKVFRVKTFKHKKQLYVDVTFLRQRAAVCSQPPLPSPLPLTHCEDNTVDKSRKPKRKAGADSAPAGVPAARSRSTAASAPSAASKSKRRATPVK
eukprot:1311030-Pleurochrysis_carterae.AAC.1